MERRTFITGIGLLTGVFVAAGNGIKLVADTAKSVLVDKPGLRVGDVFTIDGVYSVNNGIKSLTKFHVINSSVSDPWDDSKRFRCTDGYNSPFGLEEEYHPDDFDW